MSDTPTQPTRYTTAASQQSGTCILGPETTAVFVLATAYDRDVGNLKTLRRQDAVACEQFRASLAHANQRITEITGYLAEAKQAAELYKATTDKRITELEKQREQLRSELDLECVQMKRITELEAALQDIRAHINNLPHPDPRMEGYLSVTTDMIDASLSSCCTKRNSSPEATDLLQHIENLTEANRTLHTMIQRMPKAYEAWIKVVMAEHSELVGLAFVHGWRSTRVEEGIRLREELDVVLADYHKEYGGQPTVGDSEFDQIMGQQ